MAMSRSVEGPNLLGAYLQGYLVSEASTLKNGALDRISCLRGGSSVGQGSPNRFFAAHVFVLPIITAILVQLYAIYFTVKRSHLLLRWASGVPIVMHDYSRQHGLLLHIHRAMYAVIDRQKLHGIHVRVLAKCLRMSGGDHLHPGTVMGLPAGSSKGPW